MVQLKSAASTGTRPKRRALRICAAAFRRGTPALCQWAFSGLGAVQPCHGHIPISSRRHYLARGVVAAST